MNGDEKSSERVTITLLRKKKESPAKEAIIWIMIAMMQLFLFLQMLSGRSLPRISKGR
jgi:hypothetical protein